jgi:hypothetical protein
MRGFGFRDGICFYFLITSFAKGIKIGTCVKLARHLARVL